MIHITEDQVREALPVTKAVELVEDGFRRLSDGRAVNQPRRRVVLDNGACLHYMAAGENEAGYLATKVYATRPRVGARFAVLLFDAETTELLASIDANVLGQIRTGAASGVATRHMAREDAATLAMIGSGFQAETQLEAVAAVRKLKRVRVYSRSPERREAFARRMSQRLVLPIEAAARAEDAISEATIVVTVTTAREPVFDSAALSPGCHINAAGSNHHRRAEIDAEAVSRAQGRGGRFARASSNGSRRSHRRSCRGTFRLGARRRTFRELGIHLTQVTPRCSVGPGGGLPARPTRIRVSLCERGGLPRLSVRLALTRGFPLSKVWA